MTALQADLAVVIGSQVHFTGWRLAVFDAMRRVRSSIILCAHRRALEYRWLASFKRDSEAMLVRGGLALALFVINVAKSTALDDSARRAFVRLVSERAFRICIISRVVVLRVQS